MMKIVRICLKVVAGIVVVVLLLAALIVGAFHTDFVQQRLLSQTTLLLQEHLKTDVRIDHVSLSLFGEDLSLHGVEIADHQHRKMFQLRELGVKLKLLPLLNHEVSITKAHIKGLEANIYKPASDSDSVANFQFVVDAFKTKKKVKKEEIPTDSVKKHKLTVNVDKLDFKDIKVTYNDTTQAQLGALTLRKGKDGLHTAVIEDLSSAFVQRTKKGPVDNRVQIGRIKVMEKEDGQQQIYIDRLNYRTDNHLPHKRTGKPKRGYFDAGHFNVIANFDILLNRADKDSIIATVNKGTILDRTSGLNVTKLTCKVATDKKTAQVRNFNVQMPNTSLSFDVGDIQLPSKKEGRKMQFKTSVITGRTLLKDISRPFAPVLKNFTLPLTLQTNFRGDNENLIFENVRVASADKQLEIAASGSISGLKDKYKLNVHFNVQRMTTHGKYVETVINQFPLKRKFMMKQLNALGRIDYTGHFEVLWKREQFAGRLNTAAGAFNFQFALDENNKYLTGTTQTDSFELGKAMDMPDLGKIVCKAQFKFDYSKPRTAKMRRLKGGKLPIGRVEADVIESAYKKIRVRNLNAVIVSDGAEAVGNIVIKGKRVDLLCSFTFTNTNEMQKTKIKPGIRFHGLSEEDKAAKEKAKEQKRQEKAARKAQKAEEKAALKAQKADEKAARDAQKAEEKAARKARKAEEKAARKAEKEARKAEKEAAKAAKKAAQAAEE